MVRIMRVVVFSVILSAATLFQVPAQTNIHMLRDLNPDQDEIAGAGAFTNFNGTFFFAASGGGVPQLWKSNGTEAGTVKVLDSAGLLIFPALLYPFNGYVYFQGMDGLTSDHGIELWRSNGTTAGTAIFKDIVPGTGSSIPWGFKAMGNYLYFCAFRNVDEGIELWRTDGTDAGTALFKDLDPQQYGSSSPQELTVCGNQLFFTAVTSNIDLGMGKRQLWVSDGTEDGTRMVKDIAGADIDEDLKHLTVYNNKVYFSAYEPVNGVELWSSDGTEDGTTLVTNLSLEDSSSFPSQLTVFKGKLYFTGEGGFGPEIYLTDGSSGGTHLLYDFETEARPDYLPLELCVVGDTLFFTALYHNQTTFFSTGYELYKSNGSPGNATLVKDINTDNSQNPDTSGSGPVHFTAIDGKLYFAANDVEHGYELWVSDGTSDGTRMVKDINEGAGDGIDINSFEIIQCGSQVFFNAVDGVHGNEIWTFSLSPSGRMTSEWIVSSLGAR